MDSDLERELGLDSLGRGELLSRLERELGTTLPEQALGATSGRELLALLNASRSTCSAGAAPPEHGGEHGGELSGEVTPPAAARTLVEVLCWHARRHPRRVALQLYQNDDRPQVIRYAELFAEARSVAAGLRRRGLEPGQTVALMLATERGYFASFFGVLLAGGTPVPIYPPARPNQIEEHLRRHARILANAETALLITVPQARLLARLLRAQVPSMRAVVAVDELSAAGEQEQGGFAVAGVGADDLAFLQYTSGSTGDPKGVMLSHANLLANIRAMARRLQVTADDVFVSWLPLYHDMGLIGACLGSLYQGIPLVVMSPLRFLRQPASWLWAIHRHRGTISAGPNFAYELCLRQIDETALAGLDLGSWRYAANGAEPVSADTLRRFTERFGRYGFDPAALAPVYGLAECSVGLALPAPGRGLKTERVDRAALARRQLATPADPARDGGEDVIEIPACGHALAGHQLRAVDEAGRELPPRHEGRLQFRGPSATRGYLHHPEATAALFDRGWLNTGDRGFIVDGDVYLTGRAKDMIIRGGRNLYPYELEQAVAELDGVRKGCVAVFASPDPRAGSERLVVVAETRLRDPERLRALTARIRERSAELLGVAADDVVLAPPHAVLKTSSGKIRRAATAERYRAGRLHEPGRRVWLQFARLLGANLMPLAGRSRQAAAGYLYGVYALSVAGLLSLPVWLVLLLAPTRRLRWRLGGALGRLALTLLGIRLRCNGLQRLPAGGYVAAINHSSYLDALVLASALPEPLRFVAKRELGQHRWLRLLLGRMGTLFAERFDQSRAQRDSAALQASAAAGERLGFFPEGSFTRAPGLLPFRMGAFVTAARTGTPLVPIALLGTRALLRAGSWLPRRVSLSVEIGEPIAADGDDWAAAARLRARARTVLLDMTREPDLDAADSPLTTADPELALPASRAGRGERD